MPSKHITYNTCLNEAYLQGFFETLDTLLSKQEKKEEKQRAEAVESPHNEKRDQLVPIYMYCKNLWDKWLIHPNDDGVDINNNPYTVKKFFKNFLFIDSFYRNIYNLLPVNCQKFMDIVDGLSDRDTSDNTSLYSFIGNFAKLHKCLFVAIPDYINLGSVDNDGKMQQEGINNMTKLFKCIPHNEMRSIQTDNKFIVIYTHEPSKNQDQDRGFINDSISICDDDGNLTEEAKELFGGITPPQNVDGSNNKVSTDNMDTPAYPIPGFAVAFSGHNNHIFKAVDVNMDNPIATEHSINILSYIAQLGSGNGQKVAYQGQDVFPIFSNYAYQSTITMMGNAQIQPLMYYQLMNIPMWKGAYMIFNVKHNIVPGNMTTTFTGMKMSKNCVPFLEKWVYPVECVVPQPTAIAVSNENSVSINGQPSNGTVDTENHTSLTVDRKGAFKDLGKYVRLGGNLSELPGVGTPIKNSKGNNYTWIIIHCTAGPDDNNTENAYDIHYLHKVTNGWTGCGYNFLILSDGTVQVGRSLGYTGGHTRGTGNTVGIAISWCGGIGKKDTRTSEQKQAMHNLVDLLKKTYGITQICGHRNCLSKMASTTWQTPLAFSEGAKSCPNFDAAAEFGYNPPDKTKPG